MVGSLLKGFLTNKDCYEPLYDCVTGALLSCLCQLCVIVKMNQEMAFGDVLEARPLTTILILASRCHLGDFFRGVSL